MHIEAAHEMLTRVIQRFMATFVLNVPRFHRFIVAHRDQISALWMKKQSSDPVIMTY
jgi:hypothetical protein